MEGVSRMVKSHGSSLSRRTRNEYLWGYTFVLPALCIIGLFVIFPAIKLLIMSMQSTRFMAGLPVSKFIGLTNYEWILEDDVFYTSLWNSFFFPLVVTPIQSIVALGMAVLLTSRIRGRSFLRTVYFIPVILSFVTVSMVWKNMLNTEFGVVNMILRAVGLAPQGFLTTATLSKPSIAFVSIWKGWPWYMVIFTSGLNNIDKELYEAATIDGANAWQRFCRITLPLLKNTTLFVIIISTMNNIKIFTPVMVMTSGGPMDSSRVIIHYIWTTAFRMSDFGMASAMSVVLFVIMLTISLIQYRVLSSKNTV